MFYCEACAIKNEWPSQSPHYKSFGKCEICEQHGDCNDVPSKHLPIPKRLQPMHPDTKAAMDSTLVGAKAGYEKARSECEVLINDELLKAKKSLEITGNNKAYRNAISALEHLAAQIRALELKEQS